MAKPLKDAPITAADIQEYLDSNSDFTFEIKVLNLLRDIKYKCWHSGTYTDPVTSRMREYDIRTIVCKKVRDQLSFNLFLAIECKNLRENFPLVVSCLPTPREDAFEEMIFSYEDEDEHLLLGMRQKVEVPKYFDRACTIRQNQTLSLYQRNLDAGKSCDQVGRAKSTDEIQGSDSDVFEKISQAINSSYDLVQEAVHFQEKAKFNVSVIKPMLVVPDGSLWRVVYDAQGTLVAGPDQTEFVPYFFGKTWEYTEFDGPQEYTISHLDIVTVGSLQNHINACLSFENEDLLEHLQDLQDAGQITKKAVLKPRR